MSLQSAIIKIFQGGAVRRNTISATAGNVATNLTPAGGSFRSKRWKILRGTLTLTCDATVANRFLTLTVTDGTNIVENLAYSALIIATQTYIMNLGEIRYNVGMIPGGGGGSLAQGYLGVQGLYLEGSDQLRITVASGVAGDSYSGYLEVLETVI